MTIEVEGKDILALMIDDAMEREKAAEREAARIKAEKQAEQEWEAERPAHRPSWLGKSAAEMLRERDGRISSSLDVDNGGAKERR